VVFPTGVIPRDDMLVVYYGAADEVCGVVELRRSELLEAMAPAQAPGAGKFNPRPPGNLNSTQARERI
jgi:hypothetical protein